ncbi:MAG: hypothetical protein ACE5EU_02265 [Paracoccaceae bacterium]
MKLPRIRPLTVATVALTSATILRFFPMFEPADAEEARRIPLHIVLGMTIAATLFSDWYGKPGIRGWIDSVLATLGIVLIGASISTGVFVVAEKLIAGEWESLGRLLVEIYLAGQFATLVVFVYLLDTHHLAALALATIILHHVARYERSKRP